MLIMELHLQCCVRGYHIYKAIWTAAIGEELPCIRETSNVTDRYSVAVTKDDVIVGHLPKKYSKIFLLFIRRSGAITCKVTGRHCYSRDLLQGGLEISCKLILLGKSDDIKNVNKLIKKQQHGK